MGRSPKMWRKGKRKEKKAKKGRKTYLVQRTGDGIAAGLVTNRWVDLGGSEASEEGDDGCLGEHGDGLDGIT